MPEPGSMLPERPLKAHPFPAIPAAVYEEAFRPHADEKCVFCRRIAMGEYDYYIGRTRWSHEVQARISIPGAVTFEPLNPVVPGHRLFVPVRHVRSAAENAAVTAEAMWAAATFINGVPYSGATGVNIITSVGEAATQTVMHLHVHLVPRKTDDGLKLPWTDQVRP